MTPTMFPMTSGGGGVLLSVDPLVQMPSRNKLFQVSLEQLALGGIMPTLFVVHAHSEATPCYSQEPHWPNEER